MATDHFVDVSALAPPVVPSAGGAAPAAPSTPDAAENSQTTEAVPPQTSSRKSQKTKPADEVEIDLTNMLGDLEGRSTMAPPDPEELEEAADGFRSAVTNQDGSEDAAQHLKLAHTYLEMGMSEEAIGSLVTASRLPRQRFEAASTLARLYRNQQDWPHAIEWYERAAEAPAPSADAGARSSTTSARPSSRPGRRREPWPCSWSSRPMPANTAMSLPGCTGSRRSRREADHQDRQPPAVRGVFPRSGVILVVAPWSGFWEHNRFAASHATVAALISSPFVRGAVSGIGVITVIAGLSGSSRRSSPVDVSRSVRRRPNDDAVAEPATDSLLRHRSPPA